jgi:O-antigen/teichoic acid export membrane protein
VAIVIGLALYVWAPALATGPFHDPGLSPFLRFIAVTLPATAYTDAALAATQGFKTMKPYASINLFFEPACRIVLTVALLWAGWGLVGLMVALLITNSISAVLASIALKRLMGRPQISPRYDVREIFSFSVPSWLSNLASTGLLWADIIILSIYASSADVAIYQVATRLTLLATVFIQPVTNSFAPRIADFWRRKRYDLMKKTFKLITSWVVRLSLPSFVVLLIFPRQLLGLFGPEFLAGITVTRIMTVAWLLNAASGPCGYVLTMSGRPKVQMGNYSAALILNVVLNVVLISRFGIEGAATAWATTVLMLTVTRVLQVWFFARMLPFSRDLFKGFGAALVAAAGGVAIDVLVKGALPSLLLGVVVVGLIYVVCIRLLGLEEDDRLVLDALRQRFRLRHA